MFLEALNDKGKEIFEKLKDFPGFYLAGGTALALQIGHRISIDFDFFSEKEISKNLLTQVEKLFSSKKISVSVNNPGELTVFVDGVKITFLHYPFPVLTDFILLDGIKFLSVQEIAATKAYSIGRRGTFKDYTDLFFIISEKYSTLEEIIGMAEKKYSEFNSRLFLEQLIYLDDIQDTNILFLKDAISKEQIKEFFLNEIKNIKL